VAKQETASSTARRALQGSGAALAFAPVRVPAVQPASKGRVNRSALSDPQEVKRMPVDVVGDGPGVPTQMARRGGNLHSKDPREKMHYETGALWRPTRRKRVTLPARPATRIPATPRRGSSQARASPGGW
jgi:hypothetical protein